MASFVKTSSTCGLMKLPIEIRQKIFTLAVTVPEPITPIQVKIRSNKFFWTKSQKSNVTGQDKVHGKVYGIPQLTVVQLSKVSRQFYAEVIQTYMFYKVNHFEFLDVTNFMAYLVAITPNRLLAIRSIKSRLVSNFYNYPHRAAQAYTLLSACQGLQSLELELARSEYNFNYSAEVAHLDGCQELLLAVRGLKSLSVVLRPEPANVLHAPFMMAQQPDLQTNRDKLERILQSEMTHERPSSYSIRLFKDAQKVVGLHIDGDGRLGEDRKPGIVASRTRLQIRNLEKIDSDGTVTEETFPKYDLNGDLAWMVDSISASRETDEGISGLEFLVRCYESRNDRYHRYNWEGIRVTAKEESLEESWEDISVLNSFWSRREILLFYTKNPSAYGKKIVLDIWKLGVDDNDDDKKRKDHLARKFEKMMEKDKDGEGNSPSKGCQSQH
jgi:hypothetical protein